MTVDQKTAKHICNVIRRQIENGFPGLHLHFITHQENERERAFAKDVPAMEEHRAGQFMVDYVQEHEELLHANRSRLVGIAERRSPGFLGLFRSQKFFVLCFINYDRFRSQDTLRNHVLHLMWHVIELHEAYTTRKKDTDFDDFELVMENNVITAEHTDIGLCHSNFKADIFSCSLQALSGRPQAIDILADQRIHDTLRAERGFFAERFPFPVCLETLEMLFEKHMQQYKKIKTPISAAKKITKDIGETFKVQSIEQWRSFAIPAQEMAWNGYQPETILGTAIYTGEDTYAHSIADMIAERTQIKPESITFLEDYNPFANTEVNERAHKRKAKDILNTLFAKMPGRLDHIIVLDVARKQNQALLNGSPFGWCVHGLLPVIDIIKQKGHAQSRAMTVSDAKDAFNREISSVPWETLEHFHKTLLEYRREGISQSVQDMIEIARISDEFTSIQHALSSVERMLEREKILHQDKNISDFMGRKFVKTIDLKTAESKSEEKKPPS